MVSLNNVIKKINRYLLVPMPSPESEFWGNYDLDGYNRLVEDGIQYVVIEEYDKYVKREINNDMVNKFIETIDNGRYREMNMLLFQRKYYEDYGHKVLIPDYFMGMCKYKYSIMFNFVRYLYF